MSDNEHRPNESETGDRVFNDQTEAIRSKYQLNHIRGKLSDMCPFCDKPIKLGDEVAHRALCVQRAAAISADLRRLKEVLEEQEVSESRRKANLEADRTDRENAEIRRKLAIIGFVICPVCKLALSKSRVAAHHAECHSPKKSTA